MRCVQLVILRAKLKHMKPRLRLYNTYSRSLEVFAPLHPDRVGLYLCGPTVYGPPHLGHARSAIVFDVIVRYLRHLGYKVRYVRNITDVGHLTYHAGQEEDKVARQAILDQLTPMEVAQRYGTRYEVAMRRLNVLPPSIAPRATGHITAQLALVDRLLAKGFAYVCDGSVYFDLQAYQKVHAYGQLSRRSTRELLSNTRPLVQEAGKRSPHDFVLWKRATEHAMQWPAPWGAGSPGWHLACTAMSQKYLGDVFDIHGGGQDLAFPHHEGEIAQAVGATGVVPARYWLHNNMVTIQGKKMSKSAANYITLEQCFEGEHPLLSAAYAPMVVRFFMLQRHYRTPIDCTDGALQAARKGYYKLINGLRTLRKIPWEQAAAQPTAAGEAIAALCKGCHAAMAEDFDTAQVIVQLFALCKWINRIDQRLVALHELSREEGQRLQETYTLFVEQVLGLQAQHALDREALIDGLMAQYVAAKKRGDAQAVAEMRQLFHQQGLSLEDRAQQVTWSYAL